MPEYEHSGSQHHLEEIDGVREAHVAALNAGDAEAWVAQFTDDGVQMPPNAPANVGKTMIGAWSHGLFEHFAAQFALAVQEVHILGQWALERGGYTINLQPHAGGPAMQDSGKYITLYQRKAGEPWRMARDIWNSDMPPPGM